MSTPGLERAQQSLQYFIQCQFKLFSENYFLSAGQAKACTKQRCFFPEQQNCVADRITLFVFYFKRFWNLIKEPAFLHLWLTWGRERERGCTEIGTQLHALCSLNIYYYPHLCHNDLSLYVAYRIFIWQTASKTFECRACSCPKLSSDLVGWVGEIHFRGGAHAGSVKMGNATFWACSTCACSSPTPLNVLHATGSGL